MRWPLKRTFDYRDVFIFNSSLCKDGELPAVCQRKKIPQNAVAFLKKQTNERIQHASSYETCNQIVIFWGLFSNLIAILKDYVFSSNIIFGHLTFINTPIRRISNIVLLTHKDFLLKIVFISKCRYIRNNYYYYFIISITVHKSLKFSILLFKD